MTPNRVNPALLAPTGTPSPGAAPPAAARPAGAFEAALRANDPVVFSNHALQRLARRGIDVSPTVLKRLTLGVGRAAGKGSQSSVVFINGTAFVVSVNNRTVLTAVDPAHMRDHVFTNIDSAVIA